VNRTVTESLAFVATVAVGAATGWLVGSGPVAPAVGAAAGLVAAVAMSLLRIRPLVAIPSVIGTVAGALIGRSVVHILCLPAGCPTSENVAAVLTGAGALVGVAVVVGLASRSIEEYRESVARSTPPPITGCGPGDTPDR
jgi:hypothetical protein